MRVIIAGSRDIKLNPEIQTVEALVRKSGFTVDQLICGMAPGIDMAGFRWAEFNNIPIMEKPANWGEFGRSAGPRRNREMVLFADALIAIWDGRSPGTRDMILQAQDRGLKVFVWLWDKGSGR